uniref:Carboxylic ester hydrolase n=1 Tax=Neogobius melanostomus TaxID=47308 RepID=A0A8C6SPN8_9GOBI
MASSLRPLILFLLLFVSLSLASPEDLLIQTKNGKVQGTLLPVLGGHVRTFLGIPYAKPPIGTLRFRPPQPADKWDKTLEASSFPNSCYQVPDTLFPGFQGSEMWNPNTPVSEDCLYLNVWSPPVNRLQPQALAPVLVWIYGGGFLSGTSSLPLYNGCFLCKSENVVVVSINYRLGAFGFLALPDHTSFRGNAGLMDQQLALRWVAENIDAFGGDPSKVTIFGESAGSASVGYHLLSPGSRDLFQRAVMQSGSPNAPWARQSHENVWNRSKGLVQMLGCPLSPHAEMDACLQRVKAKDIASKQLIVPGPSHVSYPYAPVIDGIFMPRSVEEMLSSNDLPKKDVLFGINQDEGTYFTAYHVPGFDLSGQSLVSREDFLRVMQKAAYGAAEEAIEAVVLQYTDWTDQRNTVKNRDNLAKLHGDVMFVCPVQEFMQKYSQRGAKTFLYWFDHRSSVNPWPEWMGVMHGYEIEFVFGMPLNATLGYTNTEVNMTRKVMKHWANFARTGNPGIDGAAWPHFTSEKQEYVTLNSRYPEIRTQIRPQECHLWNTVVPKIQRISDDLRACRTSAGNVLRSTVLPLLLVLLVTPFIFNS